MKKIFSLVFLGLLLSCTKGVYHVASVQSEEVKPVDKDFVFENEHLRVVYNLWEPGGRMRFLLFNKMDKPLYIDWTKSAFVRNGVKTSYSQLPPVLKRGYTDTVRYTYQNLPAEPYRMTARANQLTEIPSQTYVAIADCPIQQMVLHAKTKEKVFIYTKENTPLRVSQQLAYSFDKILTNPYLIEHSFWVNKIQVVDVGELTKLYGSLRKGQPNALYTVETRDATGRTVVLAVGLVGVGVTVGTHLILQAMFSGPWLSW